MNAVSTSESWDVNRHTARCTGPVSVLLCAAGHLSTDYGFWGVAINFHSALSCPQRPLTHFWAWESLGRNARRGYEFP